MVISPRAPWALERWLRRGAVLCTAILLTAATLPAIPFLLLLLVPGLLLMALSLGYLGQHDTAAPLSAGANDENPVMPGMLAAK